jgi:hypothetical protein
VILWAVATQAVSSDLELSRAVAESQETKDTEKKADSFGRDRLDSAYVDGLRIISKPIAKVNPRNHDLVEFRMLHSTGHGQSEEGIFDVTVSPYGRRRG